MEMIQSFSVDHTKIVPGIFISREDIVGLIYLINRHAEKLSKEGKHLNAQDERALIDARNRMNNEIAVALNMEPDSVIELIHEKTGLEDFA